MTNLEIDQRLAEAMGKSNLRKVHEFGQDWIQRLCIDEWLTFSPTRKMGDAWKVGERFGLASLTKNKFGEWRAYFGPLKLGCYSRVDKMASMAISKGALKVIEGRKSNEQ